MPFVDASDPSADYLSIRITGEISPASMAEGFAWVKQRAAETGLHRIFFDMREVTNSVSDLDRFQIGVHGAEILTGGLRCAVVGNRGKVSRLAEDVAVNRGLSAFVTEDPEVALNWLLSDEPSTRSPHVG